MYKFIEVRISMNLNLEVGRGQIRAIGTLTANTKYLCSGIG